MKRSLILFAALVTPACALDQLDFHEETSATAVVPENPSVGGEPGFQGTGATGGWGVGGQCGRQLGAAGLGGAGDGAPFLRGGYGGNLTSVEALEAGLPRGGDPGCPGPIAYAYDDESCDASSVCLSQCSGPGVAPGDACDFPLTVGTTPGVCREAHEEGDLECTLPCASDCECPNGSVCRDVIPYGSICMIPETPNAPGCTDNLCLPEGLNYRFPSGTALYCDVDAPCCAGLTCNRGQCTAE